MAGREFITARLDGAKELEEVLEQLPKAMGKKVLRDAAKVALVPVLVDAMAGARQDVGIVSGKYRYSYTINSSLTSRQRRAAKAAGEGGNVDVYVGSNDFKAHLIEFGTRFMRAVPVLRPAWDANKDKVFKIFFDEIGGNLSKAAARLFKKAFKGKLTAAEKAALRG